MYPRTGIHTVNSTVLAVMKGGRWMPRSWAQSTNRRTAPQLQVVSKGRRCLFTFPGNIGSNLSPICTSWRSTAFLTLIRSLQAAVHYQKSQVTDFDCFQVLGTKISSSFCSSKPNQGCGTSNRVGQLLSHGISSIVFVGRRQLHATWRNNFTVTSFNLIPLLSHRLHRVSSRQPPGLCLQLTIQSEFTLLVPPTWTGNNFTTSYNHSVQFSVFFFKLLWLMKVQKKSE